MVPNVVNNDALSVRPRLKNDLVESTILNFFAPDNFGRISSSVLLLWWGLSMYLFRWLGSRHNLMLPLGFHKHTNELSHSDFSSIFNLCNMPSFTNFLIPYTMVPGGHVQLFLLVLHTAHHRLLI